MRIVYIISDEIKSKIDCKDNQNHHDVDGIKMTWSSCFDEAFVFKLVFMTASPVEDGGRYLRCIAAVAINKNVPVKKSVVY